jgi:hypothetical protein
MKRYLQNLALTLLNDYVYEEHDITTPSGSYLYKHPRKQHYTLKENKGDNPIATLVLSTNARPLLFLNK